MKVISPLLGYTLKTIYQPLELLAKYRELTHNPFPQNFTNRTNIAYGNQPEQVLDIYRPQAPHEPKERHRARHQAPYDPTTAPQIYPKVIYVHGGNFVAGDKCTASSICRKIASRGYEVYNINYRLAPKFTYAYQLQDIALAIQWITRSADTTHENPQPNKNPSKPKNRKTNLSQPSRGHPAPAPCFLMGDTAGANLVLTYTTALSYPYLRNALNIPRPTNTLNLKGLVLLYGAYDLEAGLFHHIPFIQYWYTLLLGERVNDAENWLNLASPLRHLHYHLPPIFIGAGEADPLFSQSILLARKLKEMHHPYATAFYDRQNYPDGQHLFFTLQFKACAQRILEESLLFLDLQSQKTIPHPHTNRLDNAVS